MLVEMADMAKRSPVRIVENVLVKIDKFLFPSDFVVMDMLNTCNEAMILGRPFLATIHAEIDVFNKEISLGIGGDRVTFDMDKKIHNFTTPIGEIYMINTTSNTPSDASSRVEETNDMHNDYNQEQRRSRKRPRKLKFNINLPSTHFCKPVKQILEGELKFWPTCDPNIKECNGGHEVYEVNKEGDLKKWYCYHDDDRKRINGTSLSFPEFLLVKYGENQEKGLIWDERFEEWCINNPNAPTSRDTKVQENLNPRPKDYPFKDWLLTKVGHTNVSEPVKKTLLKTWLIDCFQEDVVKDPRERSFDDYKWMFDLEIDQLADEYELGIGKKGHMLEDIWENCRKVQGDNTYWWHDQKSEEEERRKLGIDIEEIDECLADGKRKRVKIQGYDPKGSGQWKDGPPKDIERLKSNLNTRFSLRRNRNSKSSRLVFMWYQVSILAKDKGFGHEMHKREESKAVYGVTPSKDYAVTYSNEEMSHHTLYDIKPLLLYAATFKFTRDDLSESALRRNTGDKVTP
ncbi:phospholipase-like protein [Tanacetum coccineum]